uniref:Uncharacterized protein n=1 Tax=Panagrolaimus sp. JU765 TaxID=591449 RepID=A0AC34R8N1_9BILA
MVIQDNLTAVVAEEYVEMFGLLSIYYRSEKEQKGFSCFKQAGMFCLPDMEFSNCSQYKALVECDTSIYERAKCPTDFKTEFCHFLANDLKREEVIDSACVAEIHKTCNGTNTDTNAAPKNIGFSFLVLPLFIRIFHSFSKF